MELRIGSSTGIGADDVTSQYAQPGLFVSEITTILLVLHSSRFKYLKSV